MDSATLSAHFVKFTNLTPSRKWTHPTPSTCHPSTNGLGHTPRTFRKIYQPDTLEKNGLAQLPLPAIPQLMDSATLRAHFEKFTNLTPSKKWTRPTSPTCHPSTNGLGHTPRTFRKIYQPDTSRKNGLSLMNMHYANDMQMSRQTESRVQPKSPTSVECIRRTQLLNKMHGLKE